MLRRILVPYDFLEPSKRACDVALELAIPVGASLVLVHVVEPLSPVLALTAADHATIDEGTAQALNRTALRMRPYLRDVETRVVEGKPWQEIDRAARDIQADLVVMGTHARRGLSRAVLGSIAAHVVRTSTVPVTTVNPYVATSRNDAGARLAVELGVVNLTTPLVVALSRGALTIATKLAERTRSPVDLWVVEPVTSLSGVVIGAIGEDDEPVLDFEADAGGHGEIVASARQRLRNEVAALRGARTFSECSGRDVVLVSDGLFSPAMAQVAMRALEKMGARTTVVASPVVGRNVFEALGSTGTIVSLDRATVVDTCVYRDDVLPSDLVASDLLVAS